MRKLTAVVAVLTAQGLMLGAAGPAHAWSNGRDGPNSYGTHDWILDKALEAAGDQASWVRVRVALRATDDPDTVDGIDHASGTWWHVWDEWGKTWGGAPEAVEVWFERAQRRIEAGKERAASKALGIMSHLLGDVAQPMHTDGRLDAEDDVHAPYEDAVDSRSEREDDVYRFVDDGPDPASPEQTTLGVARQAHRYYVRLVRAYDRHGYNETVHRITRRQLNRAARALADLIRALA